MDRPKTGLNVVTFVSTLLMDNGFTSQESSNFNIVTDEAPNLNAFGKFYSWYRVKEILDNHSHCVCHVLNTIAKRITLPYKKSTLNSNIKDTCSSVTDALNALQKCVVKLRGFTAVREKLGTALHLPGATRWTSKLDMVDCFLNFKSDILEVVRDEKPELLAYVEKVYADYESVYEDYRKVITPIKKRIKELEVS